jgi:hypothetical protein
VVEPHQTANDKPSSDQMDSEQGIDLLELIQRLKSVRALLHPDRNGGNFKDEAEHEAFLHVSAALKMAEDASRNSRALTIRGENQVAGFKGSREVSQYLVGCVN